MSTNVVIIMVDQQKASALPMYGNRILKMPNLSAFAGQGVVFGNAFTSCPLCVPARVSMFTGQYPTAHGSLDNSVVMRPGKRHLLRLLKEAGYTTGLAGKNHCFPAAEAGWFDHRWDCGHYGPTGADVEPKYKESMRFLRSCEVLHAAWGHVVNPNPPDALGTAWTTDHAVKFLRENHEKPFFLWYSIPDPHIPFQTSEPYASMYPPASVEIPPTEPDGTAGKPRSQQMDHHVMRGDLVDEQTIREVTGLYYGMNAHIDAELGRFFSEMTRLNLNDNTIVIYVSDHGEYLGEHRMIRKSKTAYECLIRIPFMVRGPGIEPGRKEAMVTLEDVMPTLLGFLGMEIPAEVQGRDWSGLLRGKPALVREYILGEHGSHAYPYDPAQPYPVCKSPLSPDFSPAMKVGGYGRMRYIRTRKWKLVVYVNDLSELYDLANDPLELKNIYGRPGTEAITAELTAKMMTEMMVMTHPEVRPKNVS